jgi:hypothetical protein
MVVIEARRADGRRVGLRFRGVSESRASASAPAVGASLRLQGVGSAAGCLSFGILFPFPWIFGRQAAGSSRVRIDAGGVGLNIVCQDAEWWEEDPAGPDR